MKQSVALIVVIPVGPKCQPEFILDTLASVEHYIHSSHQVILSDDSQNPAICEAVTAQRPDVVVLTTSENHGKWLGLYVSLCNAYRYALDNYDFEALLRLDTDALIIGHDPELPALELFRRDPTIGLAGRFIRGISSPDDLGNVWDNKVVREMFTSIGKVFTRHFLRQPMIHWRIRPVMFQAIYKGYEFGDFVFGGTYVFSRTGLEALRDQGFLPLAGVQKAQLEEDYFFSMLVKAAGLELGDLAIGDQPFGVAWIGLPASPETLALANKKIIHSTRSWKDMKEADIRQYFKDRRTQDDYAPQLLPMEV